MLKQKYRKDNIQQCTKTEATEKTIANHTYFTQQLFTTAIKQTELGMSQKSDIILYKHLQEKVCSSYEKSEDHQTKTIV